MTTSKILAAALGFVPLFSATSSIAQDAEDKAIIAVVSDADSMNIGQDGFCGSRTELDRPTGKQFRIPAGKDTFFFIRTTFKLTYGTYSCEGDFSFTPESKTLHIIRYTMEDRQCKLEMFKSEPGATPRPMQFKPEQRRACIKQQP